MRLFKAVEIVDWCFLSEAVAFLAFGEIPEADWYDMPESSENDELKGYDRRFHWKEMPENFETKIIGFDWYEPEDFFVANIEMPDGYGAAVYSIRVGEISNALDVIRFHEEHFHKFNLSREQYLERVKKYENAKALISESGEQQTLVQKTHSKFDAHLDRVWAKLFTSISEGRVEVEALDVERWESLADEGKYYEAGTFERLPPEAFRIAHDYKQDEFFSMASGTFRQGCKPLACWRCLLQVSCPPLLNSLVTQS